MRPNPWFPISERWDAVFIRKLVVFAALTGGLLEGFVGNALFDDVNVVVVFVAGIAAMFAWFFVLFSGVRLYQHVRGVSS